jgi:2',3'-cyclic-nucleotide 2'-phosphodiesterase (5'-nucleotidase family)
MLWIVLTIIALAPTVTPSPPKAQAKSRPPVLVLTADCEGHVNPCQSCPIHVGLGGIDRRASFIQSVRSKTPALLIDAGNFLFGPESIDSRGRIIVAAYDLLKYDAVNISFRDFRLGKAATLDVLRDAKFSPVSASLLDESTGQPLFAPFVVRSAGGLKVALIGITEPPAGLEHLPQLQGQLEGIRIRPASDALDEVIPQARARSDKLILVYYGSGAALRRLLDAHPHDFAAVCAGGFPPDEQPPDRAPLVASVEQHGKEVAQISLPARGIAKLSRRPIDDSLAHDPAMKALIESFAHPAPATRPVESRLSRGQN